MNLCYKIKEKNLNGLIMEYLNVTLALFKLEMKWRKLRIIMIKDALMMKEIVYLGKTYNNIFLLKVYNDFFIFLYILLWT